MTQDPTIGAEDGAPIAAEYVLGVLSARERRAFEARLAREPALAAEVDFWETRLGVLASEAKSVTPPAETWIRIEAALAGSRAKQPGLWQSLSFWRFAAIGSAAVAAASLLALVYVARPPVSGQPLVAKLDLGGGQSGFVAVIDPSHGDLTIVPASVAGVNQKALELWFISPGDKPRSLGLIEPGRPVRVNLPTDLLPRVGPEASLAISLEPLGGSPTGQPTGPVLASGKLTNL